MVKNLFSYTTASFCSAVLFFQVSHAYNTEDKEVVVTASRLPQSQVSKISNLEIVTSKEIEAHNATNVFDVLKLLPGIQYRIKSRDILLRVFSRRKTLYPKGFFQRFG